MEADGQILERLHNKLHGVADDECAGWDLHPLLGLLGAPCGSACLYSNILVSNGGTFNTPGKPTASIISRNYGSQFDFSGWSIPINPTTLTPGPHTLYVTATSSVTGYLDASKKFVGKTTTASVTFNVLDLSHKKIQPDPLLCKGIPC